MDCKPLPEKPGVSMTVRINMKSSDTETNDLQFKKHESQSTVTEERK
jgi:hypothetical protein